MSDAKNVDRVVLVTGATRGIGKGIAEFFAEAGYSVVCCSTNQEKSEKMSAALIEKYNVKSIGLSGDVGDFDVAKNIIDETVQQFGQIDVLVNNAGITKDNLLLRMGESDWNDVIRVNLNSVYNFSKNAIRYMIKKRFGRIINITSVVGVMGNAGQSNYAASKGGVISFTKSLAKEVGARGVTCNAIAPGFIETDMISTLPEQYINNIIKQIPQQRLGAVEDIANCALYLASSEASYVTGQTINVDGGMLM